MKEKEQSLTTKRIRIYLAVTFLMTYAYEFLLVYPVALSKKPEVAMMSTMAISVVMFVPALGALITRIITKEGYQNLWLKPNFKGNFRYYLFGWIGPAVLTLIGTGIYFLIFPGKFDGSMSLLQNQLAAVGQEMSAGALKNMLAVQLVMAFVLAPMMNALPCFGEEWGWRGYLLPKMMEKYPIGKVLLINGVIWGLWHAPITAIGHNYGMGYFGWPVTGILAMCLFCIVMGVIFSYITIKTGSCLPAVLAHGSLNGIASIGIYFTADGGNPFVGPAPTGIIGAAAFIAVAIVLAVRLMREKKA